MRQGFYPGAFFIKKTYNPNPTNNPTSTFLKIESKKKATIGEISIMPIGGINLLNGPRKISLNALNERNGSLCHLTFGNQDNKIVINKTKNIKSNILAIAIDKPIGYFPLSYQRATVSHEQVFVSSISSIILNNSF